MFVKSFFERLNLVPFFDGPAPDGDLPVLDDIKFLESDDNPPSEDDEVEEIENELEDDSEEVKEDEEEKPKKDNKKKEKEDDKVDEDESEEEEDESEEEELEEEEEIDDKADVVDSRGKISVKALKEQYPDIFKKNPGLKDVIFRERELSKYFATTDDAKEAAEKVETLEKFEETLMNGEIGSLLDTIAEADESAAVKLAENFLPELYHRSQSVFAKVTAPVIKAVIRNTFNRAQKTGNKQLSVACQYLTRELFENPDVVKATEFEEEKPNPERDKLEQEKRELQAQKYKDASNEVIQGITSRLKKDISSKLTGNMSDFVRDALSEKIINELDVTLAKDKAHMAHLNSLWKKAAKVGFSAEAKNKIIAASLSRAKTLLPTAIGKIRSAQSKGKEEGKKIVKGKEDKQIPSQKSSNKHGSGQPKKLGRNVSDYDFLSMP